jgi:hypothetical protein
VTQLFTNFEIFDVQLLYQNLVNLSSSPFLSTFREIHLDLPFPTIEELNQSLSKKSMEILVTREIVHFSASLLGQREDVGEEQRNVPEI